MTLLGIEPITDQSQGGSSNTRPLGWYIVSIQHKLNIDAMGSHRG